MVILYLSIDLANHIMSGKTIDLLNQGSSQHLKLEILQLGMQHCNLMIKIINNKGEERILKYTNPAFLYEISKGMYKKQVLEYLNNISPEDVTNEEINYVQDEAGFVKTPLLWAITNGHNDFAYKFIEKFNVRIEFASTEILDAKGNTIIGILLAKGCNSALAAFNSLDYPHSAFNILQEIKQVTGNAQFREFINLENRYGNTALHIDCIRKDEKLIKFLLENGADFTLKNIDIKLRAIYWSLILKMLIK